MAPLIIPMGICKGAPPIGLIIIGAIIMGFIIMGPIIMGFIIMGFIMPIIGLDMPAMALAIAAVGSAGCDAVVPDSPGAAAPACIISKKLIGLGVC